MGHYAFSYPAPNDDRFHVPDEVLSLETSLGENVIWFEELDEQLSTSISFLLGRGDEVGRVVTAQLSFRAKVELCEALFRQIRPNSENLQDLRELAAACLEIEHKRNQVVHSSWRHEADGATATRLKFTAREKQGLRRHTEKLEFGQIQAIWVHCGFLAHSLDELMFYEFGEEYGTP